MLDAFICIPQMRKGVLRWWCSGDESACNVGDVGSVPGSGRFSWRRTGQPTPVSLPGKSHGLRSLVSNSPWGQKELDTTECTCVHTHIHTAPHSHTHTHTQMRKLKPRGNLPKITEWAGQGRFESSQSGSMVHVLN